MPETIKCSTQVTTSRSSNCTKLDIAQYALHRNITAIHDPVLAQTSPSDREMKAHPEAAWQSTRVDAGDTAGHTAGQLTGQCSSIAPMLQTHKKAAANPLVKCGAPRFKVNSVVQLTPLFRKTPVQSHSTILQHALTARRTGPSHCNTGTDGRHLKRPMYGENRSRTSVDGACTEAARRDRENPSSGPSAAP